MNIPPLTLPTRTEVREKKIEEWAQAFPPDVVREMKRCGLPPPEGMPMAYWVNPLEINYKHDAIIELMLAGWKKTKIAEELGLDASHVGNVTNSPRFQEAFKAAKAERSEIISKRIVSVLYGNAVEVLEGIMNDASERGSTRLTAATYVIDQTVGKAKQETEIKGSLLADFMSRVEREPAEATRPQEIDGERRRLDDLIEEHIPDDVIVGKRTESVEEPEP